MTFLRDLAKLFSQAPLTVRLVLAPGGVAVVLGAGARILDPAQVTSDSVQSRLPPPLAAIFVDRAAEPGPAPIIALAHAQKLLKELQRYPAEKLQVDSSAVETLRLGLPPATFRIHWQYNAADQRLEPHYPGADHHLGYGWFHRGPQLWRLGETIPAPLLEWLNRTWITSSEIYRFVATILPAAQQANLPLSCDLSLASDFQLQLALVNPRPWSLEVRLTCNQPALLPALQFLMHDPLHMISGTTLLPGLAPRMTPHIYTLARRQRSPIFEGLELAELIAYELKPTAALWGLDLSPLESTYPLLDAATFDLRWQGEPEIERGIGGYFATPWLVNGARRIPFATMIAAVEQDIRFVRLDQGWLELTETYKERHRQWTQRPQEPFQLSVAEVLGVNTLRLRSTGLPPPKLSLPVLPTTATALPDYWNALRQEGLPCAVVGMETALPALLADLARKLLQLTPDLRALWLVSKARQGEVQGELKKAGVTVFSALPTASRKALPGGVYLLQPTVKLPANVEWDLVIFHDIDSLAPTDEPARRLRVIKRRWALATFAKAMRTDVDHHLLRPMQILQADGVPTPLFRQYCLITEGSQQEGLLARLTSPFRKIFGAEEAPTGRGVAIPRQRPVDQPSARLSPPSAQDASGVRPLPQRELPPATRHPPPAPAPPRPAFTFDTPTTTLPGSFLEQARLLVDQKVDHALPVPFIEHWPTYTAMNQVQLRWYFYWRTQARQGNFLSTDLSYLLLHVYEAINLIGFAAPQPAFDYLLRLGEHYRTTQPKLEQRLNDWLADFLIVYRLPQSPLDWYAGLAGAGQQLADLDLTIEAWLHSGGNFAALNSQTLYALSGYAPQKSQFYQQHNQDRRVDQGYLRGLQAVQELVQQQTQQHLFAPYRPAVTRVVARPPFADSRYAGPKAPIRIADVHPWSATTRLTNLLQQVIRYTENVLREQAEYRGRLRGIDLPAEWRGAIDRAFTQPEPRREITIDLARVAALHSDADALRERLIVAEAESPPAAPPGAGETPPIAVPDRHTDGNESALLRRVVGDPPGASEQLLRLLWQQNWVATPAQLVVAAPGHFLHVLIDEINGRAMDRLGDALLLEGEAGWQVNEEYQAGLAALFAEPGLAAVAVAPPVSTPNGDPAWAGFAAQLQPLHWELLRALVQGDASSAALEAIARRGYSTANQLIDEINALALDHVGDLVIDTSADPLGIVAEAEEMLQAMVAYYASGIAPRA